MKYIGFCVALIATMSLYSMDNFQPRTNEGNIAGATEAALSDKKQNDYEQFFKWIRAQEELTLLQEQRDGAQARLEFIKQATERRKQHNNSPADQQGD